MTATKILWGQISIVFAVVLATMWLATQWTAWRLGFQSQLGPAWFELAGEPVYVPVAFFWWWYHYDAYAPRIFLEGAGIAASGGFAAIGIAISMSVWRAREAKTITTYGSARWATKREIRAAGLLGPDGVVLGRFGRDYLRHHGPEHVLCVAPTRSGKGVGLVIPTLLTWPGSAIVHDIKGENWQLTAGWRARFGRVLLFDPTNALSAAYNPLLEVRRGDTEVRDVQNVADILVDPEGALERRNHWEKTSHSLLVGAILHVLCAEGDKTLAGVANFLSDPKRPIETTLRAMMTTQHLGDAPHPVVASAARELLNKSENERSGVLSTAMGFLALYRDPVVGKVTSRCDWRIHDLVDGERPVTLYLVMAQLAELADRKRQPKSLIAEAAITSFLTPDDADRREAVVTRRLDLLTRQGERLERDLSVVAETLALFIRFWLTVTPSLPQSTQAAAQATGVNVSNPSWSRWGDASQGAGAFCVKCHLIDSMRPFRLEGERTHPPHRTQTSISDEA